MDLQIFCSSMALRASLPKEENPLPYFRDRTSKKPLVDGGLLPEEREGFGEETAFRVLPYTMQDRYVRRMKNEIMKTVVMENASLRAVFLADYGGRLWSLYDKKRRRELLFSNPVLRTANLGVRNAWFSGGIEWNLGRYGHTPLTCSPVYFARCTDLTGHSFLRMYEYERQQRIFQQVDFHIPQGEDILLAHVTIHNRRPESVPLYWWTNIALKEQPGMRIFSGTPQVIALQLVSPENDSPNISIFRHKELPYLEDQSTDFSFPKQVLHSSEYFFQNKPVITETWEAAAYKDGGLFWERSTVQLQYRKLFFWGSHRGGAHWKDFLSINGRGDYVEIQAGLAPTQVHGLWLPGKECCGFTQAFGGGESYGIGESYEIGGDPAKSGLLSGEWEVAKAKAYAYIDSRLPKDRLQELDQFYIACGELSVDEILHSGSGWGALEARLERSIIPGSLRFPVASMGAAQQPWLEVLEGKALPWNQEKFPQGWMTDPRWQTVLESLVGTPEGQSLGSWLHLGVMRYENGDREGGLDAFDRADRIEKTALASFCRAQIAAHEGKTEDACRWMEQAIQEGGLQQHPAFSAWALEAYNQAGRFRQAWQFYIHLPEYLQQDEAITLQACRAAFECESWSFLEQQFRREFAILREGDVSLLELWYRRKARLLAEENHIPVTEGLLNKVRRECNPPYLLDFRMTAPSSIAKREGS